MWRQIFRAIGAAFKMTVRQYRRWFVFGVQFVLFFTLIGYAFSIALILPVSPFFDRFEFNFSDLSDTHNTWWIQQLSGVFSNIMAFAIGPLGVYIGKEEHRPSFARFLRSISHSTWALILFFSAIITMMIYAALCFDAGSGNDPVLKTGYYLFSMLPFFTAYMGAAFLYLHAAGIKWNRKYLKKVISYQIADMICSICILLVISIITALLLALEVMPGQGTWGFLFAYGSLNYAEFLITIMYFGFLIRAVMAEEKIDDIHLELETGASDLIVLKH